MCKTNYPGIDYSLGRANVDTATGIHYGVITIDALHEDIWDELESVYSDPACANCGEQLTLPEVDAIDAGEPCPHCAAQVCRDACFADEAIGFTLTSSDYQAESAFDGTELFITRSPYYTRAQYCSPCAPGAGNLNSPCTEGPKTFCFGPEKFPNDRAPYPVYRVADDTVVYMPTNEADDSSTQHSETVGD
jgi:hypothetical protein